MSAISADKMQNIYRTLTSGIADSVKNITQKRGQGFSLPADNASDNVSVSGPGGSYSLQNMAFSYLEPSSLYTLQRFVQEMPAGEEAKDRRPRGQVSDDAGEKNIAPDTETTESPNSVSFRDELYNSADLPSAAYVSDAYRQAALSVVETQDSVRNDVWSSYQDYVTAVDSYDISRKTLESALENERVAFASYQVGRGSILELLTAGSQLATARQQVIVAFYSVLTSKANLYRAIGRF